MSESAGWVKMADDMFSSFGDVVKDATVTSSNIDPSNTYDPSTGRMVQVSSQVQTKLIWRKISKSFIPSMESYSKTDKLCRVRGSDFSSPPSPKDVVTVGSSSYLVKKVFFDSVEVGAYFDLQLGV